MIVAAMLCACGESEVSVDYKLNTPVTLELYTESYYATLDLKGEEKMGTITATYADVNYSMNGDTMFVKRNYVIDKSRGYLKNFILFIKTTNYSLTIVSSFEAITPFSDDTSTTTVPGALSFVISRAVA